MTCPLCHHTEDRVVSSREREGNQERLRQCCQCGHRWRTIELPAERVQRVKRIEQIYGQLAELVGDA